MPASSQASEWSLDYRTGLTVWYYCRTGLTVWYYCRTGLTVWYYCRTGLTVWYYCKTGLTVCYYLVWQWYYFCLFFISFHKCLFETRWDLNKDYDVGICCFSAKHVALGRKSKRLVGSESGQCVRVKRHVFPRTFCLSEPALLKSN
jgi:hypothetical protein